MKIPAFLRYLKDKQIITEQQFAALAEISAGQRFSLFGELHLMLYGGVLLAAAGIGLSVRQYFARLGDPVIIGTLSLLFLGSIVYCFRKGDDYTNEAVESPSITFDYALLFGCMIYSLDIAYIETQFHLFNTAWKNHLLISSALFLLLSYRFDNRLVLSLSLSTFAAWFGFTLSNMHMFDGQLYRIYAIIYGLILLAAGAALYRLSVKKHFLGVYLNFAAHFLFIAVLSGVFQYKLLSGYYAALIVLSAASAVYSLRKRSYVYLVYAVIYFYIGFSVVMLDHIDIAGFAFIYFIISSIAVVLGMFRLSKLFKERA
jgi:hypothetical protein